MSQPAFRSVLAAIVLAALPDLASAQWSSDASNNLVLADRSNEQVQPKLAATADGGFYASWFDNSSGGYDVYLQRLDVTGTEQWAHNGVLVANRDLSSTQDYGLDIDASGNALLAFGYSDGTGTLQVLAQKVAPDGSLLWGSPGIFLSADAGGTNAAKISATGDGNVAVAWSASDGSVVVQKLDPDGNPLWAGGGISIVPSSGLFFLADLHGDSDGNVIVSWVPNIGSAHELWTQKLSAADGSNLWGASPVQVFNGTGGALQFGNFPYFIYDGSGGAVFVWYTVGATGAVRVQHILADGSAAFAQNGVLASTSTSQNHFEPDGAYDAVSGDIYALWRETDASTQTHVGVYAQRIDNTGARQWGNNGKVLVPLSLLDQTQMVALPVAGGGMLAAWASNDAPNPMPIHVARLDTAGNYVWPAQVVDITTEANDVGRLTGALSSAGYAAYAWTANAASFSGDIHAQNINPDATLGVEVLDRIFADGFEAP
jgi:hypothetical protein